MTAGPIRPGSQRAPLSTWGPCPTLRDPHDAALDLEHPTGDVAQFRRCPATPPVARRSPAPSRRTVPRAAPSCPQNTVSRSACACARPARSHSPSPRSGPSRRRKPVSGGDSGLGRAAVALAHAALKSGSPNLFDDPGIQRVRAGLCLPWTSPRQYDVPRAATLRSVPWGGRRRPASNSLPRWAIIRSRTIPALLTRTSARRTFRRRSRSDRPPRSSRRCSPRWRRLRPRRRRSRRRPTARHSAAGGRTVKAHPDVVDHHARALGRERQKACAPRYRRPHQ